jgi:hypothetical protein
MVAEDATHVHAIERFIGKKIEHVKLETFNYRYTALFEDAKPGAVPMHEKRVRGVRLSGGYFFGPSKRKKR